MDCEFDPGESGQRYHNPLILERCTSYEMRRHKSRCAKLRWTPSISGDWYLLLPYSVGLENRSFKSPTCTVGLNPFGVPPKPLKMVWIASGVIKFTMIREDVGIES